MGFWWTSEPTHVRLFFVYLVVVLCICLALSLRIARRLFADSPHDQRISFDLALLDADCVRSLSVFTLLLSGLVCTYGAYPTWQSHFNNSKVTGSEAWFQTVVQLLRRVSIGLLVSTILFGTSSYFKSKLARRKLLDSR